MLKLLDLKDSYHNKSILHYEMAMGFLRTREEIYDLKVMFWYFKLKRGRHMIVNFGYQFYII